MFCIISQMRNFEINTIINRIDTSDLTLRNPFK